MKILDYIPVEHRQQLISELLSSATNDEKQQILDLLKDSEAVNCATAKRIALERSGLIPSAHPGIKL